MNIKKKIALKKTQKNLIRKVGIFIYLVIALLVFLSPLLTPEFYASHDGEAHVARFAAYYQAVRDGQFPPRWAGNLNFGYGTPLFIFYYPLPGLISVLLHAIGFSYELTFKIIIAASFLASFLTWYIWASKVFSKNVALTTAALYGLLPYHFLNLYVRGDVAELMALALVPLVLNAVENIRKTQSTKTIAMGAFWYALLILAHNAISLICTPIIIAYAALRVPALKNKTAVASMIALGLLASAFFWIPALYESRYTNANLFIGDMYKQHFPTLSQLLYAPWGFGPDVQKTGGLSPQIGLIPLILAGVTAILIVLKKEKRKEAIFWTVVAITSLLMTLSVSQTIWEIVPLIKKFQFPWRFTALTGFAITALIGFTLEKIQKQKIILMLIVILTVVISTQYIKIEKNINQTDTYYENYSGTTDYHGAATTIWTAGNPSEYPKNRIEIIGGQGTIENLKINTFSQKMSVNAESELQIKSNTLYFPGWEVNIDGTNVPVEFQDMNNRGFITFRTDPGRHQVTIEFRESKVRSISDILSIVGILLIALMLIRRKKNETK